MYQKAILVPSYTPIWKSPETSHFALVVSHPYLLAPLNANVVWVEEYNKRAICFFWHLFARLIRLLSGLEKRREG